MIQNILNPTWTTQNPSLSIRVFGEQPLFNWSLVGRLVGRPLSGSLVQQWQRPPDDKLLSQHFHVRAPYLAKFLAFLKFLEWRLSLLSNRMITAGVRKMNIAKFQFHDKSNRGCCFIWLFQSCFRSGNGIVSFTNFEIDLLNVETELQD